jgi:hypothetical protein
MQGPPVSNGLEGLALRRRLGWGLLGLRWPTESDRKCQSERADESFHHATFEKSLFLSLAPSARVHAPLPASASRRKGFAYRPRI